MPDYRGQRPDAVDDRLCTVCPPRRSKVDQPGERQGTKQLLERGRQGGKGGDFNVSGQDAVGGRGQYSLLNAGTGIG